MSFVVEKKGEMKMPFLDTDRLYENIEEKYKFAQGEARKAYSDVLDTICEMPSADVQEVILAKFELISNGKGVCSNCHRLDYIDKLAKYCRYCGAKMDAKE